MKASKINSRSAHKKACQIARLNNITLQEAKAIVAKDNANERGYQDEQSRLAAIRRDEENEKGGI